MQKDAYKKIISLTFSVMFLFGLFLPFNKVSAADSLTISAEKYTVENDTYIKINAVLNSYQVKVNKEEVYLNFSSSPQVEGFNGKAKCSANSDNNWSCYVNFKSSADGIYEISATSTDRNNNILYSNKIKITICKAGWVLNSGFCIAPTTVPNNGGTDTNKNKTVDTDTTYTPLAPLPGQLDASGKPIPIQTDPGCQFDEKGNVIPGSCTNPCPFGNYLNIIIKVIIGFSAVLAMVMIVVGGIEYLTSELVSGKEAGRETITNAILGLLIALGAYLILNTINPKLLSACLDNLPQATISLGGESDVPFKSIDKTALENNFGIPCSGNDGSGNTGKNAIAGISKKFINQTEYSKEKRNTMSSSTIYVDCSSFAAQVYVCAGLPSPGNRSVDIFSSGNTKQIDGSTFDYSQLHSGDLIGWKPGGGETDGHVMIYLGGGQIIDTQNTSNPTQVRPLTDALKKRIKFVKWP